MSYRCVVSYLLQIIVSNMPRNIVILYLGALIFVTWQAVSQGMGTISGVPCSQDDVVQMMGRCMLKFTRGHSTPILAKMRKSFTCDTSLINCTVVLDTRVCLADLSDHVLTAPCKPFIDQVADYQFGVFNIPCRVTHLRATCRDLFLRRGYANFGHHLEVEYDNAQLRFTDLKRADRYGTLTAISSVRRHLPYTISVTRFRPLVLRL